MIPRIYLPDDLHERAELALPAAASHHLGTVLRRRPGDAILVFNGRHGEFDGEILSLGKERSRVRIGAEVRAQTSELDLVLCFAPLKKDATDFLVEKGTELGVARFQPVITRRSATLRLNAERMRQNAILASQQSERLTVPEFSPIRSLAELIEEWPPERRLIVCAERGNASPIGDVLAGFTKLVSRPNKWAVLCGPEGGFDEGELDPIAELPFVSLVGLGPRILRADTAALSALTLFQSILGDGNLRPPERPARYNTRYERKD